VPPVVEVMAEKWGLRLPISSRFSSFHGRKWGGMRFPLSGVTTTIPEFTPTTTYAPIRREKSQLLIELGHFFVKLEKKLGDRKNSHYVTLL
jgi:hypothetical protein